MTSKITAAVDALITAAFIEGGVSPEKVQQAHELTDQRKSELMTAIGAPCLHQIAEPAAAPFMYAIADGYGNAFFEEQGCVSSEAKDLQPEVDALNENLDGEPPYAVVAVYTRPAAPQAVQAAQQGLDAQEDKVLLNFLQDQCIDLRCFNSADGEDVYWRTIQHHMGKPHERVASEVYKDDPRQAVREAMARLARDPYCTGNLHEEDAALAAQAKQGGA